MLNKHHNMDVVVFFHKANKAEGHSFQYFGSPGLAAEFCSSIDTELVYKKNPQFKTDGQMAYSCFQKFMLGAMKGNYKNLICSLHIHLKCCIALEMA